jgi:A/G-specific adenine glycosylase
LTNLIDTEAVLEWFYQHGRHDLPWQQSTTAYRVWVSEIMLQQTQVSTVIAYYQRFMARFPDVQSLASAPQDEVLHLWTGLGYYARARNLHRTAQMVCEQYQGEFPPDIEALTALPGIGRSTAGAILALAMGQRGVILDGNVKRVLCRYHAIQSWSGETRTLARLWQIAEDTTPQKEIAAYTQAMMDLGATVCTRSKPACSNCPLQSGCEAYNQGITSQLPVSKPKKTLPQKQTYMILCYHDDATVMLQQRQSSGLWGGLWSLPECADDQALADWLQSHGSEQDERWPALRHTFSHFHLHITPVLVRAAASPQVKDSAGYLWYPLDHSLKLGLAAPVKKLLDRLAGHHTLNTDQS